MEIKVKNFDHLVELARTAQTKEDAATIIKEYGNQRAADAIQHSWDIARRLYGKVLRKRSEELKKTKLSYDEFTGIIEVPQFIKYFSAIEDHFLNVLRGKFSDDTKRIIEEARDLLWERLGNIKIDRRRILPLLNDEKE